MKFMNKQEIINKLNELYELFERLACQDDNSASELLSIFDAIENLEGDLFFLSIHNIEEMPCSNKLICPKFSND